MQALQLTIVVLTAHRPRLLRRTLESIDRELPPRSFECVVISNQTNEQASIDFSGLSKERFRLIRSAPLPPGAARNLALEEARGEWLLFLDDDAYLPAGFYDRLLSTLARWESIAPGVIGGPNLVPPDSDTFSQLSSAVLGSRAATYFSARRYSRHFPAAVCSDESLMLCNLLVRREALNRHRLRFHPELFPNEENYLIQELQKAGVVAAYDPEIYVFHERRKKSLELMRQVAGYGRGRAENIRLNPSALHWAHFVPLAWVLYAFAWAVTRSLGFFGAIGFIPLDIPVLAYLLLLCLFSLKHHSLRAAWIVALIHFSFAWGVGLGLIKNALQLRKLPIRAR
jgi:succinoglycan biosynthesis protein ExoA